MPLHIIKNWRLTAERTVDTIWCGVGVMNFDFDIKLSRQAFTVIAIRCDNNVVF